MHRIQESTANSPFPAHSSRKPAPAKLDFSVADKVYARGSLSVPARNRNAADTTSGICPCCGGELQNQQPRVDTNSNHFLYRGHAVALSTLETKMLETLVRRSPGVVARDTLIHAMWGWDEPEQVEKSIQVYVCRLRKRLHPIGVTIINVYDVGYRIHLEEAN